MLTMQLYANNLSLQIMIQANLRWKLIRVRKIEKKKIRFWKSKSFAFEFLSIFIEKLG